jgi:O-antigen biosynthesis protein WbqP
MYRHFFKRLFDIVLSIIGLIVLAIPMLIVAIIIKIDSPGPVLFKQKRIGICKTTFAILKFRSMPISVPHDTPTHQFNSESALSKVQLNLRKYSIDELPQLVCILTGKMSIIGPRPALWNQYDLIAERDKYGANDIKPGLTGWAQINGRDAIEIPEKAKFDGDYTTALNSGKGLSMDWKCFWGTVKAVLKHDGVVEGGTGELHKEEAEKEAVSK